MTVAAVPPVEIAIRHFRERFLNRTDAVAILAPWRKPLPVVPGEALDALLATHLLGIEAPEAVYQYTTRKGVTATKGRHRVGSYCPGPDNLTRWLCLDLDGAGHAEALADPRATAIRTMEAFTEVGIPAYLERSGGGKGWHIWAFFEAPIEAAKAQALGRVLAPRDAPLSDGRAADPLAGRGIEVFPKQARVRKRGYGNMVWLPWWKGAKGGGNLFYRAGAGGDLEPYVPEAFQAASIDVVERVLAEHPSPEPPPISRDAASWAEPKAPPASAPAAPGNPNPQWAEWRKRALAALPLDSVYGPWLTGTPSGPGFLKCREPWAGNGDPHPSASVADGTGEAERGAFHSFLSGENLSVFDFLVRRGEAADFPGAARIVAERSGVPFPSPASSPGPPPKARPEIRVNNRQLRNLIEDAWRAVHDANRGAWPTLFIRSGTLVRLNFAETTPRIEIVSEDALCGHLAQVADWVKVTQDAVLDTSPPRDAIGVLLASPDLSLPPLEAVVMAPVFAPDGNLVLATGYHQGARLWYEPPGGLQVPDVPDHPSEDEVRASARLLLDEILGEFPFVSPAASAHMVGAILLPFVRRLIAGPTPIHLFEAPTQGSGKGLLVQIVSLVATGAPSPGGSIPVDEDELRKKIGAELSSGRPLLVLDNAEDKRVLDSSALASATTMWPHWTDRLLGHNRMFTAPNSPLWVLTANNPRLSRELARRCVSIRIDPRMDRPWLRSGFRHPDLLDWVLLHRGEVIRAVLVLVRNWLARGRPAGGRRLGSYERWADVVGGILAAAGIAGFLENLDALYATADAEGTMWRDLIAAWWETFRDRPVRVAELFHLCTTGDLMGPVLGDKSEKSQTTRLGNALQGARDRVFGGCRIEPAGRDSHSKGRQYRLVGLRDDRMPEGPAVPQDAGDDGDPEIPSLLSDFGD